MNSEYKWLAAQLAAMVVVTWSGLGISQIFAESAGKSYENAATAAGKAVGDGRASFDGYSDEVDVDDLPEPVASDDAATAVIANQTMASVFTEIGNQSMENQRWILGGTAAADALLLSAACSSVRRARKV